MVHRGFLRSWRAAGFNERIIGHVRGLIAAHGLDVRSMRVLITGEPCVRPAHATTTSARTVGLAPCTYGPLGRLHCELRAHLYAPLGPGNLVTSGCVTCTGHSLGGALATLAAYDLQAEFGFRKLQVYAFGSPRTGNHAFARDYERKVPHTWHVVNDRACLSVFEQAFLCFQACR